MFWLGSFYGLAGYGHARRKIEYDSSKSIQKTAGMCQAVIEGEYAGKLQVCERAAAVSV